MTLTYGWLDDLLNSDYETLLKTLSEKSPIALLQIDSDLTRIKNAIRKIQENKQSEKPTTSSPYVSTLVNSMTTHQNQQLRLSIATPLLAALISSDIACSDINPEGATSLNILVKLAVDYADSLISEIQNKS
ncbi:hypothetical protein [Microcoleus sp. MON2_D5]|uniref:hypothetical protein n=1 Tax=Microcoleus sp. MON2_D5 TaxID=2818833 RepID=UPI002FD6AE97